MADLNAEISRRRTFAIISHPDAGKTTPDGEVPALRRGHRPGRAWSRAKKERPGRHLRLDGDREAARHLRHLFRHAVPVRGLLHQHPGHPGPPGLLRGHLPHPDGRRLRRHGHRRGQGRGAQTRKLFKVCAMRDIPDLHLYQQDGPGGPGPLRAVRGAGRSWASPPTPSTGPSAAARSSRASMT